MSKKADRLYIESGDRDIYNRLEARDPLKGLPHIDVFCLAMGFGFKAGLRTPLKKKDGLVMYSQIKETHWRLIIAVAVASTEKLSVAGDKSQCAAIAEEFANTGLHLIRELVESTKTGELETSIERSIMDRFKEVKQKEEEKTIKQKHAKSSKKFIQEILEKGESKDIEFKSSLRWDCRLGVKNNSLEEIIAKSIVGFMNANGGRLIIGVDDDKKILGLANDYSTCKKKDSDGFELRLRDVIEIHIGIEYGNLVEIAFEKIDNKEVCIVTISASPQPVYLQKKDGTTEFILRDGNRTVKLDPKKIEAYRKQHWTS